MRRQRSDRSRRQEDTDTKEIFKRKCPHCLKAVPFRARAERAGGELTVWTVACTSCGVVVGIVPQMGRIPQKREVESIVRGVVKQHVGKAVKALRKSQRARRR
jgi:heterodisulfide reductase subunit A-like polyferredoxin